jgi:ABC-type branched-subunit amino acid transport system substrate-binding protein
MGYVAAKMVIQALKDIKGQAEDREVHRRPQQSPVNGPMGMASFDEHHGMVADFTC